jgi:hypothetical protein
LAGSDQITLTIQNWTDFQPRKDLVSLTWFRVNADIFDGETYYSLKNDGLIFLLFIISKASKKNNPAVTFGLEFVSEKLKLKKADILSFIKILEQNQIVHKSVQTCADSCPTDRHTDITNNTDNTHNGASESGQVVVDLWNSFSQLPKVKALTDSRKKKLKSRLSEPAFDYQKAIPMILESDFLLGRTGNWKASFDWFIENETNYLKVLEGNYSKKSGQSKPTQGQNAFDVAKAQIDAINRGEL